MRILACALVAFAMLVATSQYLSHFHVPRAEVASAQVAPLDHAATEHCSLCLQFDRLPAPPAPMKAPEAYFFLIATLEAERLESLALAATLTWPPSRGPPSLAC